MSAPGTAPAAGTPSAIASRATRIAAGLVLAGLFVAMVFPRADVVPPDAPIDKLEHAAGFGVLTAILMLAWPTSRWWPAVAAAATGAVIEFIQLIPALGHRCDFDDWIADLAGIAVGVAFVRAAGPVGSGAARLLQRRRRIASDLLLARPSSWVHLATAAALGFAAGAPLGVLLDSWFVRKGPQPWQYGFVGGILGAAVGVHALWEAGVRSRLRRAEASAPCLGCGTARAHGADRCPACGRKRCATDWATIASLSPSDELRACALPILVSFAAVVVFSASSIVIVGVLRQRVDAAVRLDDWYRALPADARILGDITMVALAGAWGLARCRARLAAQQDRCGSACLACGFDLRATPDDAGVGRCQECGGGFVRVGAAPGTDGRE